MKAEVVSPTTDGVIADCSTPGILDQHAGTADQDSHLEKPLHGTGPERTTLMEKCRAEWRVIWELYRNDDENDREEALARFRKLDNSLDAALRETNHPDREELLLELDAFLTEVYATKDELGRVVFHWTLHHRLLA